MTSYLEATDLAGWFNAEDVPAGSKFALTTTTLDKAFKGISDFYGPDLPVDIHYEVSNLYDFAITEAPGITLFADLDVQFWVEGANGKELAADIAIEKFEFQGDISIVNGYDMNANITKLQVHSIDVKSCAFGDISAFKLKMELNVGLAVIAPTIAKKINSIELPSDLAGIFTLSDLIVAYYDGYIGVGATTTFIAPPLPPAPVDATAASTICVHNSAAFDLKWHIKDTHTMEESTETDTYPVGKEKCIDIKEAIPGVVEGEVIKTVVDAVLGSTNKTEHNTVYTSDPTLWTTFICKGTTLNYSCNDESTESTQANQVADLIAALFTQ